MPPVISMTNIGFSLYLLSKNKESKNVAIAIGLRLIFLLSKEELPKKAIRIIVDAAEAIRPRELERSPFNTLAILSIFLYFLKKLYKRIEKINPEIILPRVATMAPGIPAIRIPTKEAVLTTRGPGVIWEIVIISVYSWIVSQAWELTTWCWIRGIMAYPPPILKEPICRKLKNNLIKNLPI